MLLRLGFCKICQKINHKKLMTNRKLEEKNGFCYNSLVKFKVSVVINSSIVDSIY